jgi:hypothetical protein
LIARFFKLGSREAMIVQNQAAIKGVRMAVAKLRIHIDFCYKTNYRGDALECAGFTNRESLSIN